MSETLERRAGHIRGVTVTTVACLFGILAGILSTSYATGAQDPMGLLIMMGTILAQLPVLRLLGIEVEDFSAKDYLFISFMTFCLWFVTWGILLTTEATVAF